MTCTCIEFNHSELCSATPIYAELARTTNSPQEIINTMHMEMFEFPCATTAQPERVR